MQKIVEIDAKEIKISPYNIRVEKTLLGELKNNIKQQGLDNPLLVRPLKAKGKEKYEIIQGSRRFQAMKSLNMKKIPCIIKDMDNATAVMKSFSENIIRKDTSTDEKARAIAILTGQMSLLNASDKKLAETLGKPMTLDALAKQLGVSKSALSQQLEPLRQQKQTREFVREGAISETTAREIRRIADDKKKEVELAKEVVNQGLTQDETIDKIQKARKGKKSVDDLIKTIKGEDELTEKDMKKVDEVTTGKDAKKSSKKEDEGEGEVDSADIDNLDLDIGDNDKDEDENKLNVVLSEKTYKALKRYCEDKKTKEDNAVILFVEDRLKTEEYLK